MTADASGVLLTEIVNHHNGVVIATYGAVIFSIVAVVSLAVLWYLAGRDVKSGSWQDAIMMCALLILMVSICVVLASVIGVVTGSYELSEAIRVYESVYGPLPEGLFD